MQINEIALTFINNVKFHIRNTRAENIFNTDESRFNLELNYGCIRSINCKCCTFYTRYYT